MDAPPDPVVTEIVTTLQQTLGDRVESIYQFGTSFARGPLAPVARLLVLVSQLDGPLLDAMGPASTLARDRRVHLRLDTARDVLASTDVFPVFTLELLDTRRLVAGEDTLAQLSVHPEHLALHCEQSLRVLHRNLLVGYLEATEDRGVAHVLRQQIRRVVYLLRAVALVQEIALPEPPTAEGIVEVVVAALLPEHTGDLWTRLLRFARFADALEHDALLALVADALEALSQLVDAVDRLSRA